MKKTILITGASSGIGKVAAQVFSDSGYQLVLLARNSAAMEDLNLPNTKCYSVDVTNSNALKDAVDDVEKNFGKIDCLINNAGFLSTGDFTEQTTGNHKKVIDVNVIGVMNGIEAVLPHMRTRKTGSILNISSIADRKARPNLATYAASKAAIRSLTESLRIENAKHGIRICNLAPAKIKTPMLTVAGLSEDDALDVEDFAKAILWVYQQPQNICVRDLVFSSTSYEG